MTEENNKRSGWTTDSLTESFTHTRPDPSTKAPALRRGSESNNKPAPGDKPTETPKKP
jgi:hypothetical protein